MIRSDSGYIRNINWVFVAIFSVVLVLALWQIRTILMLSVAAVMLTVFATIPVRQFMKLGLSRGLSILLSIVAGIVVLTIVFMLIFPTLWEQFRVLATDIIPLGLEQLIARWNSGELFAQIPFGQEVLSGIVIDEQFLTQAATQIATALGQLGGSVVPLLGDVAAGILSVLIIIFLCLYLLAEPERYINGVIYMTPLWYRDRMRYIMDRLDHTIRAWLKVTGVSMVVVGIGTSIGLALLGIQQWAALGVLAGVLSFIPNFGPLIALIPSVAVAVIQAPNAVLLTVLVIYGVSFLQSQVVGPILANENMNLAPVLILVGQIVFGVFFGFLGIMLAVPLTAIAVVLVSEIYVKDVLGDTRGDDVPVAELQELAVLVPEGD